MKRLFGIAILATALALANFGAFAQGSQNILISTGGTTGTYYRLVEEMKRFCSLQVDHWQDGESKHSSGSIVNLTNVLTNQAELGIVQTDALVLRSGAEPAVSQRIFTLVTLHPEEIHLVAKAAPRKVGGMFGMGGTEVHLNTINDLQGRKVGVWGGSFVTAKVIVAHTLIGMDIIEYRNQAEALTALKEDKIDTILAVGGQPLSWVKELSREYKLLEIPDPTAKKMDAVYRKVPVSYPNLGQTGLQTVAVDALLVTRNYTSQNRINQLLGLRECLVKKIDEIKDERGTHPKWQDIDPSRKAKWPMYQPEPGRQAMPGRTG